MSPRTRRYITVGALIAFLAVAVIAAIVQAV